jgi:putative DNA primase/helicase
MSGNNRISTGQFEIEEIVDQPASPKKKLNGAATEMQKKEKAIVLDPTNPMASARILMLNRFTIADAYMLWRHRGCFWRWTGSYYQLTNDETIHAIIWGFLEKAFKLQWDEKAKKWERVPFKPKSANVKEVASALTAISQLDEHINPPAWLSADASMPPAGELFACANGLLHLPTGKIYPASPDYFCLNASTVTYDPKAKAPHYAAFLVELLEDDHEAIELLQDWSGYTLSPDTSQQKILDMIGPKRSGKGTLARLLTKVLGERSVAGPTMNSLGEPFGLEPLITKSLAIISHVRIGSRTDKSTIVERLLTISGEDGITVGRKFKQAWDGKMPTRIMFMSNELLALTDGSGAFASRLLIVLLTKSFYGKEDPGLTNKLAAELSGILNWAIDGYRRLAERGFFVQPESAREAIEDIEMLGSPVKAFVRDCCEVGPGLNVLVDNLYEKYKEWCEDEGRKDPGNKEWFGRNLHSAVPGLRLARPRADDQQRLRTYHGVGLIKPPTVCIVPKEPDAPAPTRKEKAENLAKYGKR